MRVDVAPRAVELPVHGGQSWEAGGPGIPTPATLSGALSEGRRGSIGLPSAGPPEPPPRPWCSLPPQCPASRCRAIPRGPGQTGGMLRAACSRQGRLAW